MNARRPARSLRRSIFAVTALLILAITAHVAALDAGARAPQIGLRDLTGGEVSIDALRGRVVVVDFWASWCEPCAQAMPVLERLHRAHARDGLSIVGVSQDRAESNVREFLGRVPVTFPIVLDSGHAVAGRYRPARMPTSFVIDRRGIVRHVHAGFEAADAVLIEREVTLLLAEH
jgi:peroxiredoxin